MYRAVNGGGLNRGHFLSGLIRGVLGWIRRRLIVWRRGRRCWIDRLIREWRRRSTLWLCSRRGRRLVEWFLSILSLAMRRPRGGPVLFRMFRLRKYPEEKWSHPKVSFSGRSRRGRLVRLICAASTHKLSMVVVSRPTKSSRVLEHHLPFRRLGKRTISSLSTAIGMTTNPSKFKWTENPPTKTLPGSSALVRGVIRLSLTSSRWWVVSRALVSTISRSWVGFRGSITRLVGGRGSRLGSLCRLATANQKTTQQQASTLSSISVIMVVRSNLSGLDATD